ncbi:hypothetical protein RQP46_011091 [Phenoliferia psychrophenolica]
MTGQIFTEYVGMLDFLGEDQWAALVRIGRTSKAFLQLAREALYGELYIPSDNRDDVPDYKDSNLTQLITFRHLAAFVRHLQLDIQRPRDAIDILAAFTACPQVSVLTVNLYFDEVADMVRALRSIPVATSSLRKLHLYGGAGWQDRPNKQVDLEDLKNTWWSLLASQEHLEYLSIDFPLPSGPSSHPPPTISLRDLTIIADSIEPSFVSRLANSSKESLRRLVIQASYNHSTAGLNLLDLSPFTNLVELTLLGAPPATDTLASQIRQLSLTYLRITIENEDEASDDGLPLMPTNWLDHLPPTLRIASLPLHPASNVVAFLQSGACPHLEKLSMPALRVKYEKYGDWSPWIEIAVATACARRGLRLVQRDPEEPVEKHPSWFERDSDYEFGMQMTLEQMWGRGVY